MKEKEERVEVSYLVLTEKVLPQRYQDFKNVLNTDVTQIARILSRKMNGDEMYPDNCHEL